MKSFTKADLDKFHASAQKKGRKHVQSRKVLYNEVWYDSGGEMRGFQRRELLEKAGEILNLGYHRKTYIFEINHIVISKYTPDYWYYDRDGTLHVEDFKPRPRTAKEKKYLEGTAAWVRFKFNQKLLKAIYGIEVEVVYE